MNESTNPRVIADNIKKLDARSLVTADGLKEMTEQVELLQTYSTTEIETGGKWIDNKTIFKRTVNLSQATAITASDWTTLPVDGGTPEIATLVKVEINYMSPSGNQGVKMKVSGSNLQAAVIYGTETIGVNSYFTLYYTKVTTP